MDYYSQMTKQYISLRETKEQQQEHCKLPPKIRFMGCRERPTLSSSKTVTMTFRKRRKREEEPIEITPRNQIIPYRESTQFLGMTLDSRLNWDEQDKSQSKIALNIIKIVAGKKLKAHRKTLRKLYSAICRSKIDYECQLYSTAIPSRLKNLIACTEKA